MTVPVPDTVWHPIDASTDVSFVEVTGGDASHFTVRSEQSDHTDVQQHAACFRCSGSLRCRERLFASWASSHYFVRLSDERRLHGCGIDRHPPLDLGTMHDRSDTRRQQRLECRGARRSELHRRIRSTDLSPHSHASFTPGSTIAVNFKLAGVNGLLLPSDEAAHLGCSVTASFDSGSSVCASFDAASGFFGASVPTPKAASVGTNHHVNVAVIADGLPVAFASVSVSLAVVAQRVARSGYWMLGSNGPVYPFGNAPELGISQGPRLRSRPGTTAAGTGSSTRPATSALRSCGRARRPPALRAGERVSTISATPGQRLLAVHEPGPRVHVTATRTSSATCRPRLERADRRVGRDTDRARLLHGRFRRGRVQFRRRAF